MKHNKPYRALIGCLYTFVLMVFLTGCGGGGSTPSDPDNPSNDPVAGLAFADAGDIVAVRVGELATLDGSGSTITESNTLNYNWSFTSKPFGSTTTLQNETTANPSFIADVVGTYMIQLVVSSGDISSQRTIAQVEVSESGNFTGLRVHTSFPAKCADCHDGRFLDSLPPFDSVPAKSPNHPATTNMCEACHTTFGFDLIRFVDHIEVFGSCSSCHNGTVAVGKSATHVETNAECDNCHNTASFLELDLNGRYDHTGITSGCATCHNGATAIGKHATHVVTSADCSVCHNTDSFQGALPEGHNTFTDNCASCHGVTATGPSVGHPVTTVDCGICHNVSGFSLGGVFNHRVVDPTMQSCESCHNGNNSINARGKSDAVNHPVTTLDCGVCHGLGGGNFANAIFDHTGIVDNCESCHNPNGNGQVTGPSKSPNHMPTILDCNVCHTTGTFAFGVFDHDPVVVAPVTCASCHDGVITAGKPVNHVPTTEDCRVCHLDTTTFTGTLFNHTGITNGCATCHDGNIAPGVTTNHIPTQDDCSVCHTDTTSPGGFMNSTFLTLTHPGITTGCQSCHTSTILPAASKAASHIPTNQDCNVCHANDMFLPHSFNHVGINNNCALCHDGNYITAGAREKTATHIATTGDCSVCHNTTNFAGAFVDHTSTTVTSVRCDSCHDGAIALGKHNAHLPTTEDCGLCHVPGTFATAIFDHTGIVDNCASCHDGITARGKHAAHVPTNSDCNQCHVTTGFLPSTFAHVGIVDNCQSCHDGVLATGKTTGHVQTTQDCGVCHTPRGFIPATFDHSTVTNNTRCDSCHGVTATGKSTNHLATTLDCRSCHTTSTFVGGTWVHDASTAGTCDTCHITNGGATPKPTIGHISTNLQCDACHNTNQWAPTSFSHDPQGNYPGDHRRALTCSACHGNVVTTPFVYPNTQYAPFCAACHAGDFERKGDHIGGENGTIQQNRDCSGGGRGCHRVSDNGF